MSNRKYRKYTKEFKLEAISLAENSEKSGVQIERDLGITPGLLAKWRARYQINDRAGQTLEPSDLASAQRENRRLRRELMMGRAGARYLKKSHQYLQPEGRVVCQFILEHERAYPVSRMFMR
jgi:transposase-like protein